MTEKPATRASQAPPAPDTPPPDPKSHPTRADAPEGRTAPSPDKPRIVVHESDACQGNISGWTCDDCEDGDCEHECHDTEPTGDLRERLAQALYRWALDAAGASRISPPVHPRTLENLYANSLARADAVLPVVEDETAALRQRAEEAERQRDEALAALEYGAETLRHAEQAMALLREVVDPDLCHCFDLDPCVHERAREHLAALDQPEETS